MNQLGSVNNHVSTRVYGRIIHGRVFGSVFNRVSDRVYRHITIRVHDPVSHRVAGLVLHGIRDRVNRLLLNES